MIRVAAEEVTLNHRIRPGNPTRRAARRLFSVVAYAIAFAFAAGP